MNHPKFAVCLLIAFALDCDLVRAARLEALNLEGSGQRARLQMKLSAPVQSRVRQLSASPSKIAVSLNKTTLAAAVPKPPSGNAFVGKITSRSAGEDLWLTVDLKPSVSWKAYRQQGGGAYTVIVELNARRPAAASTPLNEADRFPVGKGGNMAKLATKTADSSAKRALRREFIVAIDAGHGGKDVGATGPNGILEKDVVYAIARKLEDMIRAEPGMRPLMVRKGDHFVGLHRRAEIARNAGADLFISLHADADDNEAAKGSSVFTLSPHGGESVKASDRAASKVLKEMRKKQPVHHREVQKARFAVLKSPDVPSMLIETGFVSNPDEEKNLASRAYQDRVARCIFKGIRAYFARQSPGPSRIAETGPVVLASRQ